MYICIFICIYICIYIYTKSLRLVYWIWAVAFRNREHILWNHVEIFGVQFGYIECPILGFG